MRASESSPEGVLPPGGRDLGLSGGFGSVGLGWGPGLCISSRSPGEISAASVAPARWEPSVSAAGGNVERPRRN